MSNSKYSENPLDTISDSDFKEFLIAKENDFHTITESGIVVTDYLKWYETYHNLNWYAYFNHKIILNKRNINLTKTLEIIELLITERNNIINN
jgi:hypothetical protein